MRRALVLAGVFFAGLLVAVPALAAGAGREVERELAFELDAEGFAVGVIVSNNDGDVSAAILLNRGPQIAYYTTPAKVTAERVTARFGSLGELDYRFAPKRNGSIECNGAEEGEAEFDGTFVFTGENGYVHIEAATPRGPFRSIPSRGTASGNGLPGAPGRIARPMPRRITSIRTTGATMNASAGSRAKGRSARSPPSTKAGAATQGRCLRHPGRRTGRDDGRPRRAAGGRLRRLSLEPRAGHRDAAAAGAFYRLGDVHPARPRWPRDLEGFAGHADLGGESVKLAGGEFLPSSTKACPRTSETRCPQGWGALREASVSVTGWLLPTKGYGSRL